MSVCTWLYKLVTACQRDVLIKYPFANFNTKFDG